MGAESAIPAVSHTPSPWIAVEVGESRKARRFTVCQLDRKCALCQADVHHFAAECDEPDGALDREGLYTEQDACLIAAAPDLLKACQEQLDHWWGLEHDDERANRSHCAQYCYDLMEAAVTKAKGRGVVEPMSDLHSFEEISRYEEGRGFRGDKAEVCDSARKHGEFSFVDRGLLIRIATALERMEEFLRVACEPMAVRALAKRGRRETDVFVGFNKAFGKWMEKEEAKHGPCPHLVRCALQASACRDWLLSVSRRYLVYWRGSGAPHEAGQYSFIPKTLGRFAVPTAPPCGPRSKTRREWEAWRKRRVRRKKKQASVRKESHAS